MYYHWPNKTFRSDFYDWCIPLFDSGPGEFNNYTCSFLSTEGNMYFINHTSPGGDIWTQNDCCLFEGGLETPAPDWMKVEQYNGTDKIDGTEVNVWWFPGTSDPENGCFAYWSKTNELNTPFRFFGLTSVGPTILNYNSFEPGKIDENIELFKPNASKCSDKCKPPLLEKMQVMRRSSKIVRAPWPNWPSCD